MVGSGESSSKAGAQRSRSSHHNDCDSTGYSKADTCEQRLFRPAKEDEYHNGYTNDDGKPAGIASASLQADQCQKLHNDQKNPMDELARCHNEAGNQRNHHAEEEGQKVRIIQRCVRGIGCHGKADGIQIIPKRRIRNQVLAERGLEEIQRKILEHADDGHQKHPESCPAKHKFYLFFFLHVVVGVVADNDVCEDNPHRLEQLVGAADYPVFVRGKKRRHRNEQSVEEQKVKGVFKLKLFLLGIVSEQNNAKHHNAENDRGNHLPGEEDIHGSSCGIGIPVKLRQPGVVGEGVHDQRHESNHQYNRKK